ncbi:MAG TPA: hypothetical protein VFZ70_11900 [Euzebyales bacterium]
MEHLVFGRTEYAEPLAFVTTVDAASTPALEDLDVGTDWLELVVIPADAIIWILRDGAPAPRRERERVA